MKFSSKQLWVVMGLIALFVPLLLRGRNLLATHARFDLINLRERDASLIQSYDKIKIQEAWEFILNASQTVREIIIGAIDSGIDANHPEFSGVNLGRTPASMKVDPERHGTAVLGIIGANNISLLQSYVFPHMNGIVSGVTSNYILGVRGGGDETPEAFESALNDLIVGQAKAINLSLGVSRISGNDPAFEQYSRFFNEYFRNHPDISFIVAAGNDNRDAVNDTPANSTAINAIVVGATDLNDRRLVIPADGVAASNFGSSVAVAAPGDRVHTTSLFVQPLDLSDYRFFFGTSAAAPFVTGVAAILKALEPEYQKFNPGLVMNPKKIKEVIASSSDPINTGETNKPLGKDCFQFNPILHTGCRLNAHRAIAWLFPPASSTLDITTTTATTISLKWSLADFDFKNPDFIKYQLFRATGTTTIFPSTPIHTFLSSSSLSFIDTNLSPNTTYSYKLRTVDGAGLFSDSNIATATTQAPPPPGTILFFDDFNDGNADGWFLIPSTGYWSVQNGELTASGPTLGNWDLESAFVILPPGVFSWEADMRTPATAPANHGIAVFNPSGSYAVFLTVTQSNILQWSVATEGIWRGWNFAGFIDRTQNHLYQIRLDSDSTFSVWVDGQVRASKIIAGSPATWSTGFYSAILYTQAASSGQTLNTKFDNAAARAGPFPLPPPPLPPGAVLFFDDFNDGNADGWFLIPSTGYWSVQNGELTASGPTLGNWDLESAFVALPGGVFSWEADMRTPAVTEANHGIAVFSPDGDYALTAVFLTVSEVNVFQWSVRTEGIWRGWNFAGTVDRTQSHRYQIGYSTTTNSFMVLLDGQPRASNISAGPSSAWQNGFYSAILYTQAALSGQILNTKFDNATGRAAGF